MHGRHISKPQRHTFKPKRHTSKPQFIFLNSLYTCINIYKKVKNFEIPLCQNTNSYWYIIMPCIFLKVIFYKNSIKNNPHQTQKNNILFIPGTVELPCPTHPTRTCWTSRISWLACPRTSKNNKA